MKLGNPNYLWQLIEARIEFDIKILRNTVMSYEQETPAESQTLLPSGLMFAYV